MISKSFKPQKLQKFCFKLLSQVLDLKTSGKAVQFGGVRMGLRNYIVKRIVYTLFLVFFVITITFVIFEVLPGSPLDFLKGNPNSLSPERLRQLMHDWGLDQPWYIRYITYLRRMFIWNFGTTNPLTNSRPVSEFVLPFIPNTLALMGISTVLSILIGVVIGVTAAHRRGGLFDSGSVISSLITFSLPTFWMGLLFISIFATGLHILPAGRIVDPMIENDVRFAPSMFFLFGAAFSFPTLVELQSRLVHLILPITVLTLFQYGNYLLLTRATMLETLTEDYILTAKAKGLKERTIIFKHALKNASLPIITSSALAFGFLISGAMITETVFSYPGIGWLTINSLMVTRNLLVLHVIFYVSALTVTFANFMSDPLYGVVDPRIKYG